MTLTSKSIRWFWFLLLSLLTGLPENPAYGEGGTNGADDSIAALIANLNDQDKSLSSANELAKTSQPSEPAFNALVQVIHNEKAPIEIRNAAVKALLPVCPDRLTAITNLVGLLKEDSLQDSAFSVLSGFDTNFASAIPELKRLFYDRSSGTAQIAIMNLFGHFPREAGQTVPVLLDALQNTNLLVIPANRGSAIYALRGLEASAMQAVPKLLQIIESNSETDINRELAVVTLWPIIRGTPRALAIFSKLQEDRDEKIRRDAKDIMREIEPLEQWKIKSVLKKIESGEPELALAQIGEEKDYVQGNYRFAGQDPLKDATVGSLCFLVSIYHYNSENAAKRMVEQNYMVQISPDKSEMFKGGTLHIWNSGGTYQVAYRIGVYVVVVTALKPPAQPLVMKTLELLIQELGPPLTK